MNNKNLDYRKKYKIVAKHVEDFIINDLSTAFDYFPPYYYKHFHNQLKYINSIYNKLLAEEKARFVEVISILGSRNSFEKSSLFSNDIDREKEMLKNTHDEYKKKYYEQLGDPISTYDKLKFVEKRPEINAKEFKTELIRIVIEKFSDRELLSKKRYNIGITIHDAYLFSKKDNENDVLWISTDFQKKNINGGFGRKDYNLYTNYLFFLFGIDFAHYIYTVEELKLKMEALCDWLEFMYPRYNALFNELINEYEKNNNTEVSKYE